MKLLSTQKLSSDATCHARHSSLTQWYSFFGLAKEDSTNASLILKISRPGLEIFKES